MPPPPNNIPTNTVRMKASELQKLNDELEAASRGSSHARKHIRLEYLQMSVRVEMFQPGGASSNLQYAARNISAEGLGILHNSYVHPGTRCTAYLRARDGKEVSIEASAVRCRHVKGLIHEVGVKFKSPINVRDFLDVDPMEGRFTIERVDPSRLAGSLLHVDDSSMDRRLVRHFLGETQMSVVSAENVQSVLARSAERFDIYLIDNDLPDGTGIDLAEKLRASGVTAPIILLTADGRIETRDRARTARISAVIVKPLAKDVILQALAEFTAADSGGSVENGGPVLTSLKPTDSAFRFVPEFVDQLHELAGKLAAAAKASDHATVRRLCTQIKGAAPALGFAGIGDAATALIMSIDGGLSTSQSARQVKQLVSMCQRAKARDDGAKRRAG